MLVLGPASDPLVNRCCCAKVTRCASIAPMSACKLPVGCRQKTLGVEGPQPCRRCQSSLPRNLRSFASKNEGVGKCWVGREGDSPSFSHLSLSSTQLGILSWPTPGRLGGCPETTTIAPQLVILPGLQCFLTRSCQCSSDFLKGFAKYHRLAVADFCGQVFHQTNGTVLSAKSRHRLPFHLLGTAVPSCCT